MTASVTWKDDSLTLGPGGQMAVLGDLQLMVWHAVEWDTEGPWEWTVWDGDKLGESGEGLPSESEAKAQAEQAARGLVAR